MNSHGYMSKFGIFIILYWKYYQRVWLEIFKTRLAFCFGLYTILKAVQLRAILFTIFSSVQIGNIFVLAKLFIATPPFWSCTLHDHFPLISGCHNWQLKPLIAEQLMYSILKKVDGNCSTDKNGQLTKPDTFLIQIPV